MSTVHVKHGNTQVCRKIYQDWGTNTNFHTSETTNLSGLIYHTSIQDVTPHAPVDSCKDIFWSKWSGVVEWSRPRITYNNICLVRGRKYSTSFHHRIWWNFNGIHVCVRGFTDGPPLAVCFTLSLRNNCVTAMYEFTYKNRVDCTKLQESPHRFLGWMWFPTFLDLL